MKRPVLLFLFFLLFTGVASAQGFKVKANGLQIFGFEDNRGRNQVTFFSTTPLEDITGTANAISGSVSFDVANFAKTLTGKIVAKVASINTGIDLRNQHLESANWLDAKKFPEIIFEIKLVSDVKQLADNRLELKVNGNFTLHGVTKEITAYVDVTYLDANLQTQKRAPSDLLGVRAKFNVKLFDYDVDNAGIGNKVAEDIEVSVNIVGSNKL